MGLLAFLAGVGCLAMSVGLGRPGYGWSPRYAVLAAPALCALYFAWGACSRLALGQFAQMVLFTLVASMFALNVQEGRAYGQT